MKTKSILLSILPVLCLCVLIIYSQDAIAGAKTGLSLWANVIVPTLLPFILLTNTIVHSNLLARLANHPLLKRWHPCVLFCILIGFLCGYPMGAKFVNDMVTGGFLDKRLANILLVFCNNCSPMFLVGYVVQYGLSNRISFLDACIVLVLPNLLLFVIRFLRYQRYALKHADFYYQAPPASFSNLILQSVNTVCLIGVYVMLFSILTTLLSGQINQITLLPIASLEITVGIRLLKTQVTNLRLQCAYMLALTAFGGFCSIAQTRSVAPALDNAFFSYLYNKLFLALCSGVFAFFLF